MKVRMKSRPRVVCIIQARMGSTRLPGKSMMPLDGVPIVQHVLERAAEANLLDAVVLATSHDSRNAPLIEIARQRNFDVFVGSESDLVDRYRGAAESFKADVVVRIPADNPLIHSTEVDRIVEYLLE